MGINDEELVNLCLSGDKNAFGELVIRYQRVSRYTCQHGEMAFASGAETIEKGDGWNDRRIWNTL